jgi:tetratricopeptide (TPR) repeat protein
MRLLGDLASSTGKSFDQLAEAILDAQTGEFERLKEFGVRAAVAGDQVTFTFKGIKTQVDNTSEAIRGYVLSLGAAEGVSGSMEKISNTLGGRISNVQDSFTQLQTTIGQINGGALFTFVGLLQQALSYFNEIINLDLKRVQFAMEGLNMTEQRAVIKEYNAQLSKIGSTDNIGKLNQQLKFIQTNLEFYQQAMLNETDEHNRDIAFSYFNAYKDLRNNANTQMAGLQKDLAAKNAALAAEAKKTKRVIGETIDFIAPAIGIKPIPNAPSQLPLQDPAKRQAAQIAMEKELAQQAKMNAYLIQQNEILTASTLLMGTLQSGFEQMFTTIVDGGQNAFQGVLDGLKRLMIKIAAAIVAATILFFLTGGASAGGNAIKKIGELAKTMGGLGFNPFTLFSGGGGGQSPYIAMPSASTGQGGYQIDIMGDKMRLLLNNEAIKNSRVV